MTFLFQPYRETLTIKNSSILRKEIQYLAEQHGQYCRLFKRKSDEIEAVFSQEPGYLLGETVWHYFEQPPYLIYCEKLADDNDDKNILLVVVRDGVVYLDAKFSRETLTEELNSVFSSDSKQYKVYVYGDVPFNFSGVNSVKTLDKSVFQALVWDSAFQLLSLSEALHEHHLEDRTRASLAFVTILSLGILCTLWWYSSQTKTTANVNPYEQYELSLQTPSPAAEASAFVHNLQKLTSVPGWVVTAIEFNGQVGSAKLKMVGGTATQLLAMSQSMGMSVNFSSSGVFVNFSAALTHRKLPDKIASVEKTVAVVIDRMTDVLPKQSVAVDQTISNSVFKQVEMTVTFNNVSPEVLQLIGSNLDDLPVNVTSISVNVKNGLLSGYFKINVVGN